MEIWNYVEDEYESKCIGEKQSHKKSIKYIFRKKNKINSS